MNFYEIAMHRAQQLRQDQLASRSIILSRSL